MAAFFSGLPGGNRNNNDGNFNNLGNNGNWWSASESGAENAWNRNLNNNNAGVNRNNNNKKNGFCLRCVRDLTGTPGPAKAGPTCCMQLDLFSPAPEQDLVEALFQAYFDCRRNKRNTLQAIEFEQHFEANLFALHDELVAGNYRPGPSIAFIVDKPVKREVFAAAFRDRVVHHLLINKLEPLFEQLFLRDSYACRQGKGTHYGIRRVAGWVDACQAHAPSDHHILKLDVRGFFMHIDRLRLFDRLRAFIMERYPFNDRDFVIGLSRTIIFNDPTRNCIIQGNRSDWKGLPPDKSLFHMPRHCGLPIGNLTSQVLANFYMHPFDVFVKEELGVEHYGRYVDDFVLVHESKEHLLGLLPRMRDHLRDEMGLELHPRKMYLQHVSKGVLFLGCVIKPGRVYIGRRTKGNLHAAVQAHNAVVLAGAPDAVQVSAFLCTLNSYLGMLKHVRSYRLRQKVLHNRLHPGWWQHVRVNGALLKVERIPVAKRGSRVRGRSGSPAQAGPCSRAQRGGPCGRRGPRSAADAGPVKSG